MWQALVAALAPLAAALIVAFSLLFAWMLALDGGHKKRRCPGCLTPMPPDGVLACPSCGRVAQSEQSLRAVRFRRRRFLLLLPLFLFAVGPLATGGLFFLGYTVFVAPVLEEDRHWTRENIAVTKARGEAIITALQKHHDECGAYPATLDALVPAYLASLPPATCGVRAWEYDVRNEGRTFMLAFVANKSKYPCAWYDSARPEMGWYEDN